MAEIFWEKVRLRARALVFFFGRGAHFGPFQHPSRSMNDLPISNLVRFLVINGFVELNNNNPLSGLFSRNYFIKGFGYFNELEQPIHFIYRVSSS